MARSGADPFVEQVREANDIVGWIGAQAELKPAGSRFRGLCPFHGEKTPSFYVSPDHQTYHCFGCGVGGDIFTYVMEQENMTFPEALRTLADRAGIEMPNERPEARNELEGIRKALRVARAYYLARLSAPEGEAARKYLLDRGIGPEIQQRYELGLAPDSWDGLLNHAKKWVDESALIAAGLAIEGQKGRPYDRFRNRIMIPIDTSGGAPIGFGGRILSDEEPKYLNSPETPAYKKGATLYGFAPARDGIRKEGRVLVVEGYFDVFALVQAGLDGVVGSCGTALTPEQAKLLQRYGVPIVLLFDGDKAGIRAAIKALPVVLAASEKVRVVVPPVGLDPDDWIAREGVDEVRKAIETGLSPIAFVESRVVAGDFTRAEAASMASSLIEKIEDPLSRDLWVQEAAGRFGVREQAIRERVRGAARPAGRPRPSKDTEVRWNPLEKSCLAVALHHPERADEIAEVASLGRPRGGFLKVLRWLQEQADATDGVLSVAQLVVNAQDALPLGGGLSRILTQDKQASVEPDALLWQLRKRGLSFRKQALQEEIRRAQDAGDQAEIAQLFKEKQDLIRQQNDFEESEMPGSGQDQTVVEQNVGLETEN